MKNILIYLAFMTSIIYATEHTHPATEKSQYIFIDLVFPPEEGIFNKDNQKEIDTAWHTLQTMQQLSHEKQPEKQITGLATIVADKIIENLILQHEESTDIRKALFRIINDRIINKSIIKKRASTILKKAHVIWDYQEKQQLPKISYEIFTQYILSSNRRKKNITDKKLDTIIIKEKEFCLYESTLRKKLEEFRQTL